jgi:hypothetical protein
VDGGATWIFLDKTINGGSGPMNYFLAIDPIETTTLYTGGMYKSVYLDWATHLSVVRKD